MAHKKAGGSSAYGRDSAGQRLGVKLYGGQTAKPGQIIIRQRGTHYYPSVNVRRGKDDTLYAVKDGFVHFTQRKIRTARGTFKTRMLVAVKARPDKP